LDQGLSACWPCIRSGQHPWRSKRLPVPDSAASSRCATPPAGRAVDSARNDSGSTWLLPCRISIYTEAGQTRIGMIRPEAMLASLSPIASLWKVARAWRPASPTAIIEAAAALAVRVNQPFRLKHRIDRERQSGCLSDGHGGLDQLASENGNGFSSAMRGQRTSQALQPALALGFCGSSRAGSDTGRPSPIGTELGP